MVKFWRYKVCLIMATETRFPYDMLKQIRWECSPSAHPCWFEWEEPNISNHMDCPTMNLRNRVSCFPLSGWEWRVLPVHGDMVIIRTYITEATKVRLIVSYDVYVDGDPQLSQGLQSMPGLFGSEAC